jgi:signal transduction histidine kinase
MSRWLMGKTDFDVYAEARAREARTEEENIIQTGTPMLGRVERILLPGGRIAWHMVTKLPWRDKEGNIIGTYGTATDITSIKEAEAKMATLHQQLLDTSRRAGMAEVATSVLHNVGNVLNSVNVSASVIVDTLKGSRVSGVRRLSDLFAENSAGLAAFLGQEGRTEHIVKYLGMLSDQLESDQAKMVRELEELTKNIEHIKEIVVMQQNYAKISGITEIVNVAEMVEDSLRMNTTALVRHGVKLVREFEPVPPVTVEKHKVLQILINLIRNAKYACEESDNPDKQITVAIGRHDGRVRISVADNGVGIPPENLTRIFGHGFTTRKNGHGFGLHSGALAAREMGGTLRAHSDGKGRGAIFTLELPAGPQAAG